MQELSKETVEILKAIFPDVEQLHLDLFMGDFPDYIKEAYKKDPEGFISKHKRAVRNGIVEKEYFSILAKHKDACKEITKEK